MAQGNYTEALKQVHAKGENREFNTFFVNLMRLCYARKVKELRLWAQSAAELGRERQKRMLVHFQHLLRENFIYNFRTPELSYETREEKEFSERFAPFINDRNIIGIMGYSDEPLVSRDYNGCPLSSIIDGLSTMMVGPRMAKVVSWYDNEWGYSNRVVDLAAYIAKKGL